MGKAPTAKTNNQSKDTTALRRNQACRQCRKRKLKCDAQKPHCSTCVKQWNAQIAVPPPVGFTHPAAPLCIYDHMDGLGLTPINPDQVDDPKQRVSLLETQISELQTKLESAQREAGVPIASSEPSHSRSHSETQFGLHPINQHNQLDPGQSDPNDQRDSTSPSNAFQWLSVPQAAHHRLDQDGTPLPQQQYFSTGNQGASRPSSSQSTSASPYGSHLDNQLGNLTNLASNGAPRVFPGNVDMDVDAEVPVSSNYVGSTQDLIYSGWNPDLPEPRLLMHLVSLYFLRDTCASRILHRPTFILAMSLPPTHPDFPHPALLHAICASASRWTSSTTRIRDTKRGERDRFAEFHAGKTRAYIDQTIATGQNIFSVLLAAIVLSWWYYGEGRWVEVWSHAGFLTRVSIPLGLNYPGTHRSQNASPYLAPPRNPTDLEQRRRAWWMCLMFDRIVSVGGWPHSIDERDIGTELPLRRMDFENETGIASNPQDLASDNLFTRHNPLYTDPYILFLKACMLFGRVTDYNTRMINLRTPKAPPSFTSEPSPSSDGLTFRGDPRAAAGFRALDRLVSQEFLASLPPPMKSCLGVQSANMGEDIDGSALDTDLYMVHLVPHAAAITLHNPYINFDDANDVSAARCLTSARAILNAYYLIMSTSFDIKRLHPFVTICWYLAAVVLVQLCKHLIKVGDRQSEAAIWGEINLMRAAMIEFGTVSPIGIRQEKLLQGLMAEILRLTSQTQPLSVGVPLYPFSRTSLYDPTFQPSIKEVAEAATGSPDIQGGSSIDKLRGRAQSTSATSNHIPSHAAPLPATGSYADGDNDAMLGVGLGPGLQGFADAWGPLNMISAQGIWRPMDMGIAGQGPNGTGNGISGPVDIFDQLGL